MNTFPKEVVNNNNLNSNNNEFKNLIININCPSFKPCNFKNNKNIQTIILNQNLIKEKRMTQKKKKKNIPLKCLVKKDGFVYYAVILILKKGSYVIDAKPQKIQKKQLTQSAK